MSSLKTGVKNIFVSNPSLFWHFFLLSIFTVSIIRESSYKLTIKPLEIFFCFLWTKILGPFLILFWINRYFQFQSDKYIKDSPLLDTYSPDTLYYNESFFFIIISFTVTYGFTNCTIDPPFSKKINEPNVPCNTKTETLVLSD